MDGLVHEMLAAKQPSRYALSSLSLSLSLSFKFVSFLFLFFLSFCSRCTKVIGSFSPLNGLLIGVSF